MNCKKVLVIGAGFIGTHLCEALSSLNIETTVLSKSIDKIKNLKFSGKLKLIKGDILDYDLVEKCVKGKDCIINLASVVNHYSDFDPYADLDVNCRGQINVLEARKKINPNSRYIFIGSRTQFGIVGNKNLPVKEDGCQRPISLYGIHKQTAENYCYLYKRAFDLDSIILRLPQVYGPSLTHSETHSILDKFIKKAMKNEAFQVNGYGRDIKDFVYIDDVVDLIIKVLKSNVNDGTFNIGSGKKTRLIDIAKKIIKICGSGHYKTVPFPKDIEKFELGDFYFDISKISRQFKWKPKIDLDDGIKKTIEFYKRCL